MAVANGMNQTEATMKYYNVKDRNSAGRLGSQIARSKNIKEMMMKSGMSEKDVIGVVNETLSATKTMIDKHNEDRIYPDYAIRLKSAELCLRLLGYLGDEGKDGKNGIPNNIKVQFINVSQYKHKYNRTYKKSDTKDSPIIEAKPIEGVGL